MEYLITLNSNDDSYLWEKLEKIKTNKTESKIIKLIDTIISNHMQKIALNEHYFKTPIYNNNDYTKKNLWKDNDGFNYILSIVQVQKNIDNKNYIIEFNLTKQQKTPFGIEKQDINYLLIIGTNDFNFKTLCKYKVLETLTLLIYISIYKLKKGEPISFNQTVTEEQLVCFNTTI